MKVYLCLEHHEEGKEAVHKNAENALLVKKAAQKAFEKKWPELDFMKIFGKNYLDEEDRQQDEKKKDDGSGFVLIDKGLGKIDW